MNEIQRIKQLAGIKIDEDMTVGGTESDMQSADTDNRNSAYAEFDTGQGLATESAGEEDTAENYKAHLDALIAKIKPMRQAGLYKEADAIYGREYPELTKRFPNGQRDYVHQQNDRLWAGNTWQRDEKSGRSAVDEVAPPGMEKTVKDIKKEYPGHPEKAFATAWSIYNKKHGKTEEGYEMEETKYPDIESSMHPVNIIRSVISQLHPGPTSAEAVAREVPHLSRDPNFMQMYKQAANSFYGFTDSEENEEEDDDYTDWSMRRGEMGMEEDKKPGAFIDPTAANDIARMPIEQAKARAAEMISASTTNDTKKSYLMRQVEKARTSMELAGILYNMILKGEGLGVQGSGYSKKFDKGMEEGWEAPRPGALHAKAIEKMRGLIFNQGFRDGEIAAETGNAANGFKANDALDIWYQYAGEYGLEPDGGESTDKLEQAYEQGFAQGFGGLAEDLNNGYDTEQYATGSDFFPNGADSPVVTSTGPSGARQGDNPEQKKMQVAEVHKELVYGYRKFLKEATISGSKKKVTESANNTIAVKHFYKRGKNLVVDKLYTTTDGNGNYPLDNSGSVFFDDSPNSENLQKLDGSPHSSSKDLSLYELDGQLGLYDDNLDLVHSFDSIEEFIHEYQADPGFAGRKIIL